MPGNIFSQGMDAFDQSYDRTNLMADQRAKQRAGRSLAAGNRQGAMQEFGNAGMTNDVRQMQVDQANFDDRDADNARADREEATKSAIQKWTVLKQTLAGLGTVPEGQRLPALQGRLALIGKVGLPVEQFANLTEDQLKNANLSLFGDELDKHKPDWREVKNADGSSQFVDLADDPQQPQAQPQAAPGQGAPIATARPQSDAVFDSLIQQESGGRAGVTGPQTRYGQAQGMTQMLPATAQEQAKKLGVAWRPDLMTGTTPEAADYQRTLGRAYYEEGLKKYGGDQEKALKYYHGGPNEKLWGPKTQGYAQQVLTRAGGQNTMQGGQGTDRIGGRRTVPGSAAPAPDWETLKPEEAASYGPGQFQRNKRTGQVQQVAGTNPKGSGRVPATVIKMQTDLLTDLQTTSAVNKVIDRVTNQIDSGELDLGFGKNIFAQGQNAIGLGSPTSRNFASFRASLEKMRNDSLRLNKGVQTEGDAQRAWGELITNLSDPQLVKQRLAEIKDLNEQAIALRKDLVAQAREDSGMPPLDTSRFEARRTVNDPGRAKAGGGAPAKTIRYDAQGNRIK